MLLVVMEVCCKQSTCSRLCSEEHQDVLLFIGNWKWYNGDTL